MTRRSVYHLSICLLIYPLSSCRRPLLKAMAAQNRSHYVELFLSIFAPIDLFVYLSIDGFYYMCSESSDYGPESERTRGESIPHPHTFASRYMTRKNDQKGHPNHHGISRVSGIWSSTTPPDSPNVTSSVDHNFAKPVGFRNNSCIYCLLE